MKIWKLSAVACMTAFLFSCGGGGGTSEKNSKPIAQQVEITSFAPTSAAYGETIIITGQNFSSVSAENSVTFNGVAAVVTSATPTELKVTVPKNTLCSGKLNVTVAGKTVTSAVDFTYLLTYSVTTLAGSGMVGFADGIGTTAQFDAPISVAVDAAGNVYVTDYLIGVNAFGGMIYGNNVIRKITPTGVVSTFAESYTAPIADGTDVAEQFDEAFGVAVDAAGNVYATDQDNNRILKITPSGVVSTLAGGGMVGGFADGIGAAAQFDNPYGVAVDAAGNVYVADALNHRIRKITPAGVVSTFAGSGTEGFADGAEATAQFNVPTGVAVDAAGNVYVADLYNNRIRKITSTGVVSTLAGSGLTGFADGADATAQFNLPSGVAVDAAGNVYVADEFNNCIRKITPKGVVSTLAGSGSAGFADGTPLTAQFNNPFGVAVDAAGNVYVADKGNNRIRKITAE
ncbi:MAG: IPT/TIG domain-containing protein [Desulfuromonadales bacterium]|nr:IPT/TIG domain-containing protein [Desulfuromonadales bacterium]